MACALTKVEQRQETIQTIWDALSPPLLISSRWCMWVRKEKKLNPMFSLKMQYNISENESSPMDIPSFLSQNAGDLAVHIHSPISSVASCLWFLILARTFSPNSIYISYLALLIYWTKSGSHALTLFTLPWPHLPPMMMLEDRKTPCLSTTTAYITINRYGDSVFGV